VAAPAPQPSCSAVLAPRAPIELPVRVASGLTVRVRDPYGGLFTRSRLFVAFSVRYPREADRARVASVTWTLDGAPPRRDEGGRDQLLAPSTMYSAGTHVIGVRIAPAGGGAPVEAQLQVTATNCRLASLAARRTPRGTLALDVDSGGPALGAIEVVPGGRARFAVPRGGRVGTVTELPGGRRRAVTARGLDSRRRTLRIGGIAAGTTGLRLRLDRRAAPHGRACAISVTLEGGTGPPARIAPHC
jgi:hypothetical protein